MRVTDIMTKDVITVKPTMTVHQVAELFLDKKISGAPVVNDDGELLGVVLEEGVIYKDKKVHLPTFLHVSLGFITFGVKRFEEEIKKITATNVSEIMEKNIIIVSADMDVEDVATMMLEKNIYYCPVTENNKVIGVVTKRDIVKAIARST